MKNKNILSVVFVLFLINFCNSQNFEWAKSFGGGLSDSAKSTKTDSSGNIYIAGYFQYTVDFDPGIGVYNLTSSGQAPDIFICKLDPLGNFLWAKKFGGYGHDDVHSLNIDNLNNLYLTGTFTGSVDFDPGPNNYVLTSSTSTAVEDVFICKLDSFGNFIWAKQFNFNFSFATYISIDNNNNINITGSFTGIVDLDPGIGTYNLTSNGNGNGTTDIFVSKLNTSGEFIWAKSFGGASNDFVESITNDNNGNIYLFGSFIQSSDFDPSINSYILTANVIKDLFISKLNSLGEFVWAKQFKFEGNSFKSGKSLIVDENENVYTTGQFKGIGDFDPGISVYSMNSPNLVTSFISKLDSFGNFLWAKQFEGTDENFAQYINLDNNNNVYTIGSFVGTIDLNPGASILNFISSGFTDIFISKLNTNGDFIWAKRIGGLNYDYAVDIIIDATQKIYISGQFFGTTDFDPSSNTYNLISNGYGDAYVLKLGQPILGLEHNSISNSLNFFPNPTNDFVNISLNENVDSIDVRVLNYLGQEITSYKFSSTKLINLLLPEEQGVYFIEVNYNHNKEILKILKK